MFIFRRPDKVKISVYPTKVAVYSWQCVSFLDVRPRFTPMSDLKTKVKKSLNRLTSNILCRAPQKVIFPFSRMILFRLIISLKSLQSTGREIAVKKFPKNPPFEVDFKLQLPSLLYEYKTNVYNISGVTSQVVMMTEGL